MERCVLYFPEFGEHNTEAVIDCVGQRLDGGDVSTVVVATSTGKTALRFAESLAKRQGLRLIAVGNPPGSQYGRMGPDERQKLIDQGIIVVDYVPYASTAFTNEARGNVYGATDLLVVVSDVWRMIGGMATNAGVLQAGERVITVGGTSAGADTAIVMKTAYSLDIFAQDSAKRPEMIEFLCMPLTKKWWW
jgi:hypothetical protein